jgi:hypothetical protein
MNKIMLVLFCFFAVTTASANDIQKAIKSLDADQPFQIFNLDLSANELNAFQALTISDSKEYNNLGNLAMLQTELKAFLKSIGHADENTINLIVLAIDRIVTQSVKASGKETAWVALRATVPSTEFDIPRWHTDGYYYEPRKNQYKFAIILKGPGTLFYKLPKSMKTKFESLEYKDNRPALAKLLNNPARRQQLKLNEGAVFIVGEGDSGVHSEPPFSEQRLFLSVLPGSNTQIKEWRDRNKWD